MHHSMMQGMFGGLTLKEVLEKHIDPFDRGAALREPIFYGGESAYSFQYRDFSPIKYASDNQWLLANKGFSIHDARRVVYAISRLQDEKATTALQSMRESAPESGEFLQATTFSAQ